MASRTSSSSSDTLESNTGGRNAYQREVRCSCGSQTEVKSSWTKANPARKYWSYVGRQHPRCGWVQWIDDELTVEKAKVVIHGLLKKGKSREKV